MRALRNVAAELLEAGAVVDQKLRRRSSFCPALPG
jgi:hypothetical protein